MKVPFLDLKVQYQYIKKEIDTALQDICANASFVLGKSVFDFEKQYAEFCGTKDCIAVNSGTSALHLALLSLGVGRGDEVITAANTFIATCEAISYSGATPVLVDCDETTYALDPKKLEEKITDKTKAIIPVHLYGLPADMDAILKIANKYNIPVIEDAAQAHATFYKDQPTGSLGKLGCFSFYPGKNLGAYGEGGAITTSDPKLATIIRKYRDHGSDKKYHHDLIGYNYRMSGFQGAVLGIKLKHLKDWTTARQNNAELYRKYLKGINVVSPLCPDDRTHAYHLFVIRSSKRDELQKHLSDDGIGCLIHYPIPIHLQPAYAELGLKQGDYPVTEKCANEILSLPMFPELSEEQIKYVISKIKSYTQS